MLLHPIHTFAALSATRSACLIMPASATEDVEEGIIIPTHVCREAIAEAALKKLLFLSSRNVGMDPFVNDLAQFLIHISVRK